MWIIGRRRDVALGDFGAGGGFVEKGFAGIDVQDSFQAA